MPDFLPYSQDITAAKMAFEKDDFYLMNIFGNRIMSNAVFAKEGDQEWFLLGGFFVKDVATEMLSISARGKTASISTAKTVAGPYLTKVQKMTQEQNGDFSGFWTVFEEYSERTRKYQITDVEEKVYSENKQFTKQASKWLVAYLRDQKDLLLDARNQILEGILNELGRIYLVHGSDLSELILIAQMDYLQKVYAYFRVAYAAPDGKIDPDPLKSEIYPFVERIVSQSESGTLAIGDSQSILIDLMLKWREYFIRYMELRPYPGLTPERGIELPEETRKKITESITRTLEKETKDTKRR